MLRCPKILVPTLVLLALGGVRAVAADQDVFVDNATGHDVNSGLYPLSIGQSDGPVRTIRTALHRVVPGGRIVLLPTGRPYQEQVVVDGRRGLGHERFPLVIEGNGAELQGVQLTDPLAWKPIGAGVNELQGLFRPSAVLFEAPATHLARNPAGLWDPRPELERKQYALSHGQVLFRAESTRTVDAYALLASAAPGGLVLDRASHVVVRNLRIRGYRLDAVQVRGPARDVVFENCLFADNGRAGLYAGTNADVRLSGCFVANNFKVGLIVANYGKVTAVDCQVAGSPAESAVDATSALARSGTAPEAYAPGPLSLPPGYLPPTPRESAPAPAPGAEPAAPMPKSEAPTEGAPPAKKRKAFFDE